jgi:IPT/TIG domain
MRRAIFTAVAMLFVAIGAVAQEQDHSMVMTPISQEEQLARLRELLAARSLHGPAIPQPASVGTAAVKNFTITAKSFSFTISPQLFSVNQGDVVNITLIVPANDASSLGHGLLMDTYVDPGMDCPRGGSVPIQFTATTAGNFSFICNIPDCGTGHSSMSGVFTVIKVANPAPTVSGISPATGSQTGGTVVTITGTGFLAGATVKFGGTSATGVTVESATSIQATAPAHAAGKVDVVVTNTDNQSATLAQSFTYAAPAPTISSINPNTGSTSGGTPVTITGTLFQTGATVTIGALPATNVTVVSATSITALTPLGPATEQLTVDVVVTNPDATKGTASGAFTYTVPALAVASVTPNNGLPTGATGAAPTVVTIFGAGFTSALASSVSVGGVAATNVQIIDPVTIRATFPTHAAGTADVVVTIGGTGVTLKNGFSWQNAPPKHRAAKH